MKRLIAGATVIAAMLMGGTAFAKDHGRGNDKGKHEVRVERRDGIWNGHRDRDHDSRPAGWSKGKKTGWGDCDLPPGQAKKHGCYDRRHRYTYRRRVDTRRSSHRPVVGVWERNKSTRTTTTTTRTGTWGTPTVTQQTTTTTTVPTEQKSAPGVWRK